MQLPRLDGRTLMMAILAIRETVLRLEASLPDAQPSDRSKLIELLVSYDDAAEDLKHAYLIERSRSRHKLPPYEAIVPE
jgi:hypothetical protein